MLLVRQKDSSPLSHDVRAILGSGGGAVVEEQSLQQGAVTQSNNLPPWGDVTPRGGMALRGDGRQLCQLMHQAACVDGATPGPCSCPQLS